MRVLMVIVAAIVWFVGVTLVFLAGWDSARKIGMEGLAGKIDELVARVTGSAR